MKRFLNDYCQILAYLLIAVVSAIGFTQIQNLADQQTEDRITQTSALCEQAVITREAVRDGIVSLNDFLESTIAPEQAGTEEVQRNLASLQAYEKEQLKKYPPLKCGPAGEIHVAGANE